MKDWRQASGLSLSRGLEESPYSTDSTWCNKGRSISIESIMFGKKWMNVIITLRICNIKYYDNQACPICIKQLVGSIIGQIIESQLLLNLSNSGWHPWHRRILVRFVKAYKILYVLCLQFDFNHSHNIALTIFTTTVSHS